MSEGGQARVSFQTFAGDSKVQPLLCILNQGLSLLLNETLASAELSIPVPTGRSAKLRNKK